MLLCLLNDSLCNFASTCNYDTVSIELNRTKLHLITITYDNDIARSYNFFKDFRVSCSYDNLTVLIYDRIIVSKLHLTFKSLNDILVAGMCKCKDVRIIYIHI